MWMKYRGLALIFVIFILILTGVHLTNRWINKEILSSPGAEQKTPAAPQTPLVRQPSAPAQSPAARYSLADPLAPRVSQKSPKQLQKSPAQRRINGDPIRETVLDSPVLVQ